VFCTIKYALDIGTSTLCPVAPAKYTVAGAFELQPLVEYHELLV